MGTQSQGRQRRYDPRRRERVAEAAQQVIAKRGLEGLTHRAVAEQADVPLAATTYHFKDKDDLIQVALERAVDRYAAYMAGWLEAHPDLSRAEFVNALTDALMGAFGPEREQTVVELELYLAALRRPALRPIADRFTQITLDGLTPYMDSLTAATATAAAQGITMQGVAAQRPPDRSEVHAILSRIITT